MKTRDMLSAALALVAGAVLAAKEPSARLGTDAAVRLDGDDARLMFVLFTGADSRHCLETLNEKAEKVASDRSVTYRFVRSSRHVVGSGRALLKEAGKGVSIAHEFTAHAELKSETPGFILKLRASAFAGAAWTADGKPGLIPAKPEHTTVAEGETKTFTVTFPGGRKWTVTFPKKIKYAVLDTRRQEFDEIECCFYCGPKLKLPSGKGGAIACELTASDGKVKPGIRDFHGIGPGAGWVALDVAPGIRPASALDFTRAPFRKAPAGTDGRLLTTTNGEFRFSRSMDVSRRFFGCRAGTDELFTDKQSATAYTKSLAALGYNAIRMTRFDSRLTSEGPRGLQCNPEQVKQFDQLVAGAARDGLYLFFDIMCRRDFRWSEFGIAAPGGEPPSTDLCSALCLCDDRALEAWKRLATTVYGRKNKIARRTYPEDAAVPVVSALADGSAFGDWGTLRTLPFMRDKYGAWLADQRKKNPDFMSGAVCEKDAFGELSIYDQRAASIRRFLAECETNAVARMKEHLVSLKSKALLGATLGHLHFRDVAPIRLAAGDFSTAAFSFDSPRHLGEKWTAPYRIDNLNPLLKGSPVSSAVAWHERSDRPMCITSWLAPGPSGWRAVSGLLVGAWAAKHGWDAVLRDGDPLDDPFAAAAERAVFALYARGDFAKDAPADALMIDKGALTVKTPRTAGGFSPEAEGRIVAAPFAATLKGAKAAVWVSSLTEAPIASSKRLLLTHLTESQRAGTLFADSRADLMLRRGPGPWVLRDGSAQIELAVEKPSAFRVYALATDGTRAAKIPTDLKDGVLTFTACVRGQKNAQYVYEITRE